MLRRTRETQAPAGALATPWPMLPPRSRPNSLYFTAADGRHPNVADYHLTTLAICNL